ncbi:MAG TPA: glycogen/starch synthase, partial [Polyangiaceae bacterium]|nr:glycogen/starch synthase [Polyangiaceae bacterium]
MDVLMVTAELAPYARVTEAGDVVFALAKGLRQLGHRVTIALPRYAAFEEHGLLLARRLTPLTVDGAEVTVFDGQLSTGVELVLFDVPGLTAPGELKQREPDARTVEAF